MTTAGCRTGLPLLLSGLNLLSQPVWQGDTVTKAASTPCGHILLHSSSLPAGPLY